MQYIEVNSYTYVINVICDYINVFTLFTFKLF